MNEIVYNALSSYYNVLGKTGYMSWTNVIKLLVLTFYNDFVFNDYRCYLSRDDYRLIERALNCLYGTTCLIPYPDYLKMGKLHLSSSAELACRVKALEDEMVVKTLDNPENGSTSSDIYIEIQ